VFSPHQHPTESVGRPNRLAPTRQVPGPRPGTSAMTRQQVIEVSPLVNGSWAVRVAGARRTVSTHATRVYAVRRALRLARTSTEIGHGVVLVRLHNASGMIEEERIFQEAPSASTGCS
jgi:uncharacterized protein DUF2188